jgi:hypothetical protein
MANFTINSRIFGLTEFFMPDNGGYVRIESTGKSGTLASQICERGGFSGGTISATPSNFKKFCKRWHKQRLQNRIDAE